MLRIFFQESLAGTRDVEHTIRLAEKLQTKHYLQQSGGFM